MKLGAVKRSHKRSVGGVWWDFETHARLGDAPHPAHFSVLVAEWHNPEHRDTIARLQMERWRDFRSPEGQDPLKYAEQARKAADEIEDEAMARCILRGWANLERDDGTAWDYSTDEALAALRDPDNWVLKHRVRDMARVPGGYMAELEADALGN